MNAPLRARRPEPTDRLGMMGFLEHLDELRTRIIRSCIAIGAGMIVAFVFVDEIVDFVLEPVTRSLPAGSELIATRMGESFSFYFNITFIAGFIVAAPFVSYQLWRFIAPALYADEKRFVIPFVVLATVGTVCGAAFSHYVLFPTTMAFFGRFSAGRIRFMPRVEDTFDQYLKMLLAMALVFQLPSVILFLARMGLVTAGFLWRNVKYAILVIFVVAAVLTSSPDAWGQMIFALPMIALYLISIAIAWLVQPKGQPHRTNRVESSGLRLVFAATILDQATRRHSGRS